jgi:hypothetical protein
MVDMGKLSWAQTDFFGGNQAGVGVKDYQVRSQYECNDPLFLRRNIDIDKMLNPFREKKAATFLVPRKPSVCCLAGSFSNGPLLSPDSDSVPTLADQRRPESIPLAVRQLPL